MTSTNKQATLQLLRSQICNIEAAAALPETKPSPADSSACSAGLFGCDEGAPCHANARSAKRPTKSRGNNDEAIDYANPDAAYQRIVKLVSFRDRAVDEARIRLSEEGYHPQAVEEAIAHALETYILDDMRFSESFIRRKINSGKGLQGILRELERLSIDPQEALDNYQRYYGNADEDQEYARAYHFLESHPPRGKNLRNKAYQKLLAKGFSSAICSTAARDWTLSENCDNIG